MQPPAWTRSGGLKAPRGAEGTPAYGAVCQEGTAPPGPARAAGLDLCGRPGPPGPAASACGPGPLASHHGLLVLNRLVMHATMGICPRFSEPPRRKRHAPAPVRPAQSGAGCQVAPGWLGRHFSAPARPHRRIPVPVKPAHCGEACPVAHISVRSAFTGREVGRSFCSALPKHRMGL